MLYRVIVLAALFLVSQDVLAAGEEVEDEYSGEHPQEKAEIDNLTVWGRAVEQNGNVLSASEGLVGYNDFDTRPMQRVGELVEVVPGMVATQHSGEGKANQYYLRGMNLDHGTDFSALFEGMPINMRSHAHGQGYLDLNFLIPEVVATVEYRKGPYRADRGDFSTAGTTSFAVYDTLDRAFVDISAGSDGFRRSVLAGSSDLGDGHLLGALEVVRDDGPWSNESDIEKTNLLLKYSGQLGDVDTSIVITAYDNDWASTDQVPKRAVSSGIIDRFGFIDPTLGGKSKRYALIASATSDRMSAGVYASRYELNVFSNFTYFLDDPLNGDQIEQVDRRMIYGGHVDYTFSLTDTFDLRMGADLRHDDVGDTNLYRATRRQRVQTVREDAVKWLSAGAFAELTLKWTDTFRTTAGLRHDYSDYDVDALLPANSGEDNTSNVVASLSAAWLVNDHIELYANWGQGFHTNDVRGATIALDPASGDPVAPVDVYVDQEGAEVGMRLEGWRGLNATLTYFWLNSDSELLFLGDSGSTEPGDGSNRTGLELSAFWSINERWTADLIATYVDSEFEDVPSGFDHIPNTPGRVVGAGLTYVDAEGLTASLRVRHFGDAPLVEDDSIRHGATTVVNLGTSYDFGSWVAGFEVINLFDSDHNDIAYYFESQLAGETSPVEDVHFHPVVPRTYRFSVRYEFGA